MSNAIEPVNATDLTEDTSVMWQWACTRNDRYPLGVAGHQCLGAREKHWIVAPTWSDAIKQMVEWYPDDVMGFTVQRTVGVTI